MRWSVSSMLSGLFSGRVFIHSPSHEKRAVIGILSPELKNANNQTKLPGTVVGLDGTVVSDKPWNVIVGGGE